MRERDDDHWLTRPATIRRLWIGFALVLAVLVLAGLTVKVKGYFGIDDVFGFAAWFGFGSCVLMVAVAKVLGALLKRPDSYYEEAATRDITEPTSTTSADSGETR